MKFTKAQQKRIFKTLENYGIILVDNDSRWDNIQVIDEDSMQEEFDLKLKNIVKDVEAYLKGGKK